MPSADKRSIIAAAFLKASIAFRKSPAAPSSRSHPKTLPGSVDEVSATYSNVPSSPATAPRILATTAGPDNPDTTTFFISLRRVSVPKSSSLSRVARKLQWSTLLRSCRHRASVLLSSSDRALPKCHASLVSMSPSFCACAWFCNAGTLSASRRNLSSTMARSAAAALYCSTKMSLGDCKSNSWSVPNA